MAPAQLQLKARFGALVSALPLPDIPHGEEGLYESIWLLLTSVITVPLVCKLPGGSPVLGFLVRHASAAAALQLAASYSHIEHRAACTPDFGKGMALVFEDPACR